MDKNNITTTLADIRAVKSYWSIEDVFTKFGKGDSGYWKREGNKYRIPKHGGLILDPDKNTFRAYADSVGGSVIDAWAYLSNRNVDTEFSAIVVEMATAAGIQLENECIDGQPKEKPRKRPRVAVDTLSGINIMEPRSIPVDQFRKLYTDLALYAQQNLLNSPDAYQYLLGDRKSTRLNSSHL